MKYDVEKMLQWADALETWQHPQGKDRLQDSAGNYCCLGVACEIFRDQAPDLTWKMVGDEIAYLWSDMGVFTDVVSTTTSLPPQIARMLHPEGDRPSDEGSDLLLYVPNHLAAKAGQLKRYAIFLNDDHDFTFAEIAQCIRYTVARQQEEEAHDAGNES